MAYCLLAAIIPISQFCIAYTLGFVLDSFYHRSLGGSHLGQMTQATLIARGTSWRPDHPWSLLLNVISSQNAQTICYTFTGPKLMTLSFLPLFWHPQWGDQPWQRMVWRINSRCLRHFFPPLTADDAPPKPFTHGCLCYFQCWDMPWFFLFDGAFHVFLHGHLVSFTLFMHWCTHILFSFYSSALFFSLRLLFLSFSSLFFSFSFLYLQSVLRILQVLDSTSRVGVATLICQDLV